MEFVGGVLATLVVQFIAYKVVENKYNIEVTKKSKSTGGSGGGSGGNVEVK